MPAIGYSVWAAPASGNVWIQVPAEMSPAIYWVKVYDLEPAYLE